MTATFRLPDDQITVMRGFHRQAMPNTCALKRASDNWVATVATVDCEVAAPGKGGTLIDPLADDPLETVWVMDDVDVAVSDRLTVLTGHQAGQVFEVTVVPPHDALAQIQGLGCVLVRGQGVPS
jgi:hypothetical protein